MLSRKKCAYSPKDNVPILPHHVHRLRVQYFVVKIRLTHNSVLIYSHHEKRNSYQNMACQMVNLLIYL